MMFEKAFIGDFGAGNTCIYSARPNTSIREATPLNSPGGEPSGYALNKNGARLLGLGLYGLSYQKLGQIESVHINLKAAPNDDNQAAMTEYFACWLEKLKADHPEEFKSEEKCCWFIGCPTGEEWKKKETQERYAQLFANAGFQNVFVVPESNAALAFYQHKDRILDEYGAGTKILLLDQGAYSLDATLYRGGKIESYGGYLGASLIERMLVHVLLYQDEMGLRMKKRMINVPEVVQQARRLYENDGPGGMFYSYLLLQARKLKEDFFKDMKEGGIDDSTDLTRATTFRVDGEELVLFVNAKMMRMILSEAPVRSILGPEFDTLAPEIREEVGDATWMQAFATFLARVDERFPELAGGEDTIILLTGGGSLMGVIPEAVRQHYKNASVHCDAEAIAAIGKGLAYWSPDKIRAMELDAAYRAFCDKTVQDDEGDSVNFITGKMSDTFIECLTKLTGSIIKAESEAVESGIAAWRRYNCSSADIPEKIKSSLNTWSKQTGIPEFKKDLKEGVQSLKNDLNKEFKNIVRQLGQEPFQLLQNGNEQFLSACEKAMPKLFDATVAVLVQHYKENDLWSCLPNDSRGFFSDKRGDFYRGASEEFAKWMRNQSLGTVLMCKEIFMEHQFELSETVHITFYQIFLVEGIGDLKAAMDDKIREVLGKLVIEEYIE